jgi:hypothetical protein
MAQVDILIQQEEPMSALSQSVGSGSSPPVTIVIDVAGTTDISTLNIPSGSNVTLFWTGAGGGGGAGVTSTNGGGGGGGGAYLVVTIPAATWAMGGSLVVGAHGVGGAASTDVGTAGATSTLTINDVLLISEGGGAGGLSSAETGGAGGVWTIDDSLSPIVNKAGHAGTAGTSGAAGLGGAAGGAPGGTGGNGGTAGSVAGSNGTVGQVTLQFQV